MNNSEAGIIYECLSSHGSKGCGYLTIANETRINPSLIRKYIKQYPEIFSRVGFSSSYTLNKFSDFSGDKASMLSILEKRNKQEKLMRLCLTVSLSACLFSIIVSNVN